MSTTLNTVLTEHGFKTLYKYGLEKHIVYYDIKDNGYVYGIDSNADILPEVTGSHTQITSTKCALAGYNGVYSKEPTVLEINNEISQAQIYFVNENCSEDGFELPNLNVNINLNPWFYGTNGLSTLTYSTNMSGLVLDISDYLKVKIQKLNLTTQTYDTIDYVTELGISWYSDTEADDKNLFTVSPKYVSRDGNVKKMVDDSSKLRYSSPFQIFHASYSPQGSVIQNTGIKLGLLPDEVGYRVNGTTFLTCTEVETQSNPSETYSEILPAFKVNLLNNNNTSLYTLNNTTPYPTQKGLIGYALNASNSNGESLINGLITKAILFMKSNGIQKNGVYTISMNMHAIVTNQKINFINSRSPTYHLIIFIQIVLSM
jgi:hypothetical protein